MSCLTIKLLHGIKGKSKTQTARGKINNFGEKREKHVRNMKGPAEHASVSYDRPLL
jgi:hypothetical protein